MKFKTVMVYNSHERAKALSDELTKKGFEVRLLDNSDKFESDAAITEQLVVELQVEKNQVNKVNDFLENFTPNTPYYKKFKRFVSAITYGIIVAAISYTAYFLYKLLNYYW